MKKLIVFLIAIAVIFAALSVSIAFAAQSPDVADEDFIPEVISAYEVDENHKELQEIPVEFIRIESVKNAAKLDKDETELFIEGFEEAKKSTYGTVEYFFWLDIDDSVKNSDDFLVKINLSVPLCADNKNTYVKINSMAVDEDCFAKNENELSIITSDFGTFNIGTILK